MKNCLKSGEYLEKLLTGTCVRHRKGVTVSNLSWRHGVVVSGVRRMNEVNPRRARLVSGWVTVIRLVYHLGM